MDEIINISVNGNTIKKDYNCAGVQGECNSTKLRITFSENWDGFGKIITFWNALGQNPVQIQLGTNRLENILDNQNVYIIPIPGEAMTESGENTFVINGTIDGVVKRTVEGKLKVLPSRQADNAGEPEDPTPTEAAQLRQELDAVLDNIAEAAKAADAAKQALLYSDNARVSADRAGASFAALEQLSVSSETTSNSVATVFKTKEGGAYNFHFGIPKGVSGVHIGKTAPTDKDTNVWVDTSGEATGEEETEETVDQTYNPESPNAQSGIAVAEALSNIPCSSLEGVVYVDKENLVGGTYTNNIVNADGSLTANATWALWDDVIDVPNPGASTIYRFNNTGTSSIALYKQDGTVYARKALGAGGDKSYTIPSNITKIRITEQITNLTAGQTWAWEEVTEFVPYGAKPGYNYDGNPMYADLDKQIEEVKDQISVKYPKLRGKRWLFMGDSITKGVGASNINTTSYFAKCVEMSGAIGTNIGVGGASISFRGQSTDDTYPSIYRLSHETDFSQYDIVTILAGTNDFGSPVELTDISETYRGSEPQRCVVYALEKALENIFTSNPNIRVMVFAPFYRDRFQSGDGLNSDDFGLPPKRDYDVDWGSSDEKYYLDDLVNSMLNVCKKKHVCCKSLLEDFELNRYNAHILLSDGIHPSDEGHLRLANVICQAVSDNLGL